MMKRQNDFLYHALTLLFIVSVIADAGSTQAQTPWPPLGFPILTFEQVAIAKATESADGQQTISVVLPQWKTETQVVTKTKYVSETKTRMARNESNGEMIEQSYTVKVPVTIEEERAVQVFSGTGKRFDFVLGTVAAKRIDGAAVEPGQLFRLLSQPQQVFLLNLHDAYRPDPFYTNIIDPKTILLFVNIPDRP
jgi:hypothetical protein